MENQNKITYTEALQMINDKFDRLEAKIDKLDEKLDAQDRKVTILETKADTNKGWAMWMWAVAVLAADVVMHYLWK